MISRQRPIFNKPKGNVDSVLILGTGKLSQLGTEPSLPLAVHVSCQGIFVTMTFEVIEYEMKQIVLKLEALPLLSGPRIDRTDFVQRSCKCKHFLEHQSLPKN